MTTYRMEENICKQCDQDINLQNIQAAHTALYKKKTPKIPEEPNQKR